MTNNSFPELDGWDEIEQESEIAYKNDAKLRKAAHRLVGSLANLRSSISSQLGYLQNKIERLQQSADRLNKSFEELNKNIEKADKSSTALAKALNRLTFFGVGVAFLGTCIAIIQFLFENRIWPFN